MHSLFSLEIIQAWAVKGLTGQCSLPVSCKKREEEEERGTEGEGSEGVNWSMLITSQL